MISCVIGASGRLGSEVAKLFSVRGDDLVKPNVPLNYLVFAHRYRGRPSYRDEMYWNLEWVIETLDATHWNDGDCCAVLVSSASAFDPAMNQSLAYNLSKSSLVQLARYYAKKQRKFRINSVSPDTFTGYAPSVSIQKVAEKIAAICSKESGATGRDFPL